MHHQVYKLHNKKSNLVNLQRVKRSHYNLCINSFELLVKFIMLIEIRY